MAVMHPAEWLLVPYANDIGSGSYAVLPPGLDGLKVCSQEDISLIINSFLMILLSYFNSSMKGTKILGSILYLSLLRPAIFACV